ncbi:MAG: LPS export ABC transporter permease LptG [Rickettsiales bacterium]|nr:LPS export ABC transporter permease LptG [Rickettsiales bacterium]
MIFPLTLYTYIVRNFLFFFFTILAIFSVLIFMVDGAELLRKSANRTIPTFVIFQMVILKMPNLLQTVMPFIILITSVLSFNAMSKRSELVIIRSAGVSVWEFLMPAVLTAFLMGVIVSTLINPVSSYLYSIHEKLEKKYFETNSENPMLFSESGLWIKQSYKRGSKKYDIIIHAENASNSNVMKLNNVNIYAYNKKNKYSFFIKAPNANLEKGKWKINNAIFYDKKNTSYNYQVLEIPTNVNFSDIQKSFDVPESISFWKLPKFIKKLSDSGFFYFGHLMHLYKLLSSPIFYASMVLIGAIFCLKTARHSQTGYSITLALLIGFVIYFVTNLIYSLGLSGSLPVFVAGWSPIIITLLIGLGLVLHYEDG